MYHPSQLISGKEDAANNFSRGYNTVGRGMVSETMDRIRKEAECCEQRAQGFLIFHSLGGGTGSGFTSLLTNELQIQVGFFTHFHSLIVYFCVFVVYRILHPLVRR